MERLLFIFGTRPEAIKLAPVIKAARERGVTAMVCTTGQHREMLDQVLELFEIRPEYDLHLMQPNQDLSSLTARIVENLAGVLRNSTPDLVIVQGDTTTAFSGALAAFYAGIPVAHVEAGLRTYDLHSPFPEEAMRQLISRIASWHFAPTVQNAEALIREGIPPRAIYVTGNTGLDALRLVSSLIASGSRKEQLQLPSAIIERLSIGGKMILITGHRRENFGSGLQGICRAIQELAARFPDILFLYPVHLNPNVQGPVENLLGKVPNISLTGPANYYTFVYLMLRSNLIISDSGGVQEEAPSLRRPVFVTRENSERMEMVQAGAVRLVGTDPDVIVREVCGALEDEAVYNSMLIDVNPYGDGHAAERILDTVLKAGKSSNREPNYASIPGR